MHAFRRVVFALAAVIPIVALPVTAVAESGGTSAPVAPAVKSVSCLPGSAAGCSEPTTLLRDREFALQGRNLASVTRVVFLGAQSRSDDVAVRVTRATSRLAVALVPARARSGRLRVMSRYGRRVTLPRRVLVQDPPKQAPLDIAPASRFFYDGTRKAVFAFVARSAAQAQVQLINEDSGLVARTWTVPVTPGQRAEVAWDGRDTLGVVRTGRYRFGLVGATQSAVQPAPGSAGSFFFADHLFPIRGRHNLGYTATNGFGGARNHKGQDMFARCGTRLAAARGGQVQFAGFHSAAGYYVVIDGADTDRDYVYMHMRLPALVSTGDRVFTGQKIGEVGDTGRASGCHLHFEMWSAPGWYEGGSAFDPLPALREWDGYG